MKANRSSPIDPDRRRGTCLMVFARAPVEGRVKTRLAARLGDKAALALYRCFAADLLRTLDQTGHPVQIHFSPPAARAQMADWLGSRYPLIPQKKGDLGEKMAAAFHLAFAGQYEKSILIGTDFPDLPAAFIDEAFTALDRKPAVIGPSHDGGYFLIGFQRKGFLPAAFEGIAWGTAHVLGQTARVFEKNKVPLHYLSGWWDIDTYEDLLELSRRLNTEAAETAAETRRVLAAHPLLKGQNSKKKPEQQ